MQVKCDIKGCDYVANHVKPNYAKAMVGRHKNYVHGIKGKGYVPKVKSAAGLVVNSPTEPEPAVIPNYCPNCGCGIRAIMVAMNLRRKS